MNLSRTLLVSLVAAALSGCPEKAHDPAPDPCRDAVANPLTFRFLEFTGTPSLDTVYNDQPIVFDGPGAPYTEYQWRVGNDTRSFTSRRFSLAFGPTQVGALPVRLIARRPPNTACFPKDDGVDTLTRVLTFMPKAVRDAPIYGKFQGYDEDAPRDTFTIRIYRGPNYFYPNNPNAPLLDLMRNLGRGCQSPYFSVGLSWKGMHFNYGGDDSGCLTPIGSGYLTGPHTLRVEYEQFAAPVGFARVKKVFIGRRVR